MAPERNIEGTFTADDLAPDLLVCWNSRAATFFGNLRDTLLPKREGPVDLFSFPPSGEFWPDVFVKHPSRLRFLFDSYAGHVLFVLIVYGLSTSPLFQQRAPVLQDRFANGHIEYYPISPYLPPVATPPKPAQHAIEGQPAFAKQEIISVPPEPDNSRQTIITPDVHLLKKDIPLPNVVVLDKPSPIQPLEASANLVKPKLLLPADVIAPAPEDVPTSLRTTQQQPEVIKPAADLPLDAKSRLSKALAPSVIEPPPAPDALQRQSGAMNIAKLGPDVAPPKLPVAEQRAAAPPAPAPAPAPPFLQGVGSKSQGRMLALSVQPAEVKGPIEVPAGSRKGVFAAGPSGKEGAPGIPTIPGGGVSELGKPGKESGHDPLEGIYIGPALQPKQPVPGTSNPNVRAALSAALRTSPMDIPRIPATNANVDAPSKIENQVFGTKRFYSMVLNMPNLTSAVGSWIVRYAELIPSRDQSGLSAPVALNKVDPAYPAELMRDRVEGTVVLYAIIRADGSVEGVRVLESADERLNQSAMRALSHWRFRPGTKEGVAIDIEAVVRVPFHVVKWRN